MALANSLPSQDTLDRAPARALTFLLAVGRSPSIRGALQSRGYSDEEHAAGWAKLLAVDPSMARAAAGPRGADPAARDAFARIDRWDNENLPIADVALAARVPEAHAVLFADGLSPADGAESVRVVTVFLDRVDAIEALTAERPAGRKGAKPADAAPPLPLTPAQARAAVEILHARGITAESRKTARGWLETLQKGAEAFPPGGPADAAEPRREAVVALYLWLNEWSTIARRVITRRDHLLSLRLAARKPRARKADAPK